MHLTPGDIAIALSATLAWALGMTINKFLSRTIGSVFINTARLWSGFGAIIIFIWVFGKYEGIFSCSVIDLIFLASSGIIAMALGDKVFIRSLSFIYVSQAYPVCQCTFFLLTVVIAILFLSETFTLLNIVGGVLILGGLYLVTGFGDQSRVPTLKSAQSKGLILTFSAAIAWTIGAVILKLGVTTINAIVAAAIRTFSGAAVLTIFQFSCQTTNKRSFRIDKELTKLFLIILSGMLNYGVGGIAYVAAMQRVGAGRTVLITSLTPVFILILSVLFLKEKATSKSVIGTIICVAGVVLLST
jgi:drug/metabolite transporter (DMT)-like permease